MAIFNTPKLILLNLDCFFSLNNPNSPSPLTKPQNRQLDSFPSHLPIDARRNAFISSQFLPLSGRYPFQKRCFMRHQGKEGGVGRSLSQFETLFNQFIVVSQSSFFFDLYLDSDLCFGFLENRKYWASWQHRLFLQIETETVNFRHANCRRKEEDGSCRRWLPWPAGLASEKTLPSTVAR